MSGTLAASAIAAAKSVPAESAGAGASRVEETAVPGWTPPAEGPPAADAFVVEALGSLVTEHPARNTKQPAQWRNIVWYETAIVTPSRANCLHSFVPFSSSLPHSSPHLH